MAKGDSFRSDQYAQRSKERADQYGMAGAEALGQGAAQGAQSFREGMERDRGFQFQVAQFQESMRARQFDQVMQQQQMQQRGQELASHLASQQMQRDESAMRLQHLRLQMENGMVLEQLKGAKLQNAMVERQIQEQDDAKAALAAGNVPYSDRVYEQILENPILEDPNAPFGFVRQTPYSQGIKKVPLTKDESERHKIYLTETAKGKRASQREELEIKMEYETLQGLVRGYAPEAQIQEQRARVNALLKKEKAGTLTNDAINELAKPTAQATDIEQKLGIDWSKYPKDKQDRGREYIRRALEIAAMKGDDQETVLRVLRVRVPLLLQ